MSVAEQRKLMDRRDILDVRENAFQLPTNFAAILAYTARHAVLHQSRRVLESSYASGAVVQLRCRVLTII